MTAIRTYAVAQNTGLRGLQCDATAVRTIDGVRAYALLDGIGTSTEIREWTRTAARRLAASAARLGDAEAGLRHEYQRYEREQERHARSGRSPKAAAVVAVVTPEGVLRVAWCGDARAYLLAGGSAKRLTRDHNLRRVFGGRKNILTSCLGSTATDAEARNLYNHPVIEATERKLRGPVRLLLGSDGAYEPHAEARRDLGGLLDGVELHAAARWLVDSAVATSVRATVDSFDGVYADNATALLADLS